MNLSPIFKLREEATPALIDLLESVTLGTNGAHYRHLDTRERIRIADSPLHLTIERNGRAYGNITFCRREKTWYVRYFAFDTLVQGSGRKKSQGKTGKLKQELQQFFDDILDSKQQSDEVNSFYAYIDPNNEKSLWMSENFGFETKATIATQTFSRTKWNKRTKVERHNNWHGVVELTRSAYGNHQYYFEHHLKQGPFYILKDNDGEVIACAKATKATWAIERLPGKMGGWLPKVIPFIPSLRKIIRPNKHTFLVPEAVVVKGDNPAILKELFEGILTLEKEHLLLWWVDETLPLYQSAKNNVRWGILHRLIGVNKANLVVRHNNKFEYDKSVPAYTCGFDFV